MANPNNLSIMVQPRDSGWVKLGTGNRYQVAPESIEFGGDVDEYGCLDARWVMTIDPRLPHLDLEHFTPVVIMDGAEPVWSGRLIALPGALAEGTTVTCEAQGWGQHTKDQSIDKIWGIADLTKWFDQRQAVNAILLSTRCMAAGTVSVGDRQIYLGTPTGVALTNSGLVGVTLDYGPNNTIGRAVVTIDTSNNTANQVIGIKASNSDNVFDTGIGGQQAAVSAGATQILRCSPSGSARYLHIYMQTTAAYTPAADVWAKVRSALVFSSTSLESGDASAIHASTIIGDVLDACCPLISSDRSGITPTTFNIPEFYT